MRPRLDLTPDEQKHLSQILDQLAGPLGQPVSLNEIVARWADFVDKVERGYVDSIYEYINDLSVRDILEDLIRAAMPTLRTKLESALNEVDGRFTAATENAARPLVEPPVDTGAWWRRIPKRRTGELAKDLEALGYLG